MTKEKNNEPNTRGKERNGRAKEYIAPSGLSEGESAKDMEIKTIHASIANEFVRKQHYSGKIAVNSCLHFGVFWKGELEGVLQYGSSLDKRKIVGLVKDTGWNQFLELNRMAFSQALPRNSESRALAITMKLIRRHLPRIKWVVSFADATQCGSGTIYRASGFVLTGSIVYVPAMNEAFTKLTFTTLKSHAVYDRIKRVMGIDIVKEARGAASMKAIIEKLGAQVLKGYQIRYIYFIDQTYREKLTVPEIPFSRIRELNLPDGVV